MAQRIAFLGLGVMGYPMAGHLARAGHRMIVYNRSAAKAERWVAEFGGTAANGPSQAARDADLVMMCVGNDDDVRAVASGEHGALSGMQRGSTLIDHTTASAQVAREIAAIARTKGIGFLDAPVSGGQAGAEKGKLTIMVGGDTDAFARAESVLATYARAVTLMGPVGAGQLTKMVNQICVAGAIEGIAEGLNFAQHAGLDPLRVLDVISKGAAQSWQMENRGKTMVADQFDFGFAVDWMRKDLAICLAEARANGAALPVTALLEQFYARIQARGGGRWDTSSLIRLLRDG
ncbi:MAG TPA: NAD(P)-dependent oxidoreductase [Casimicrobiaceae bacterium]|jgi:3-hydroxyisobutyrate dehydrogenase-like beta-hydroxyacid dehydrogenase